MQAQSSFLLSLVVAALAVAAALESYMPPQQAAEPTAHPARR